MYNSDPDLMTPPKIPLDLPKSPDEDEESETYFPTDVFGGPFLTRMRSPEGEFATRNGTFLIL